eukprot:2605106-Prymnesium_polylepis.1
MHQDQPACIKVDLLAPKELDEKELMLLCGLHPAGGCRGPPPGGAHTRDGDARMRVSDLVHGQRAADGPRITARVEHVCGTRCRCSCCGGGACCCRRARACPSSGWSCCMS